MFSEFQKYENYNIKYLRPSCFLSSDRDDFLMFRIDECLAKSVKKSVLLIGNSHAAQFSQAMIDSFPKLNIMQANSSGCTGFLPLKGQKHCVDLFNYIYNDFLPNHHLSFVVISTRLKIGDVDNYIDTVKYILRYTDNVLVIGPVPEYNPAMYQTLARAKSFKFSGNYVKLVNKSLVEERFELDRILKRMSNGVAGLEYFSVLDSICKPDCPLYTEAGELFSFDYGHLTYSGAIDVINAIELLGDIK